MGKKDTKKKYTFFSASLKKKGIIHKKIKKGGVKSKIQFCYSYKNARSLRDTSIH